VRQPWTIITDRELALINVKAKPYFPALKKPEKGKGLIVPNEKFLEFIDKWRQLL
jgi:hypothetical protein